MDYDYDTPDASDALAERFEQAMSTTGRGQRRGPAGGRKAGSGGSGGSGGPGGNGRSKRDVVLSKALSRLLRHQADAVGITLDKEGFAPLDKVFLYGPIRSLKPTFSEIVDCVKSSDKQRFAMKPNPATNPSLDESSTDPSHWLIRANQGHSIKLDSEHLLRPIVPNPAPDSNELPIPPVVVHGTYFAFWPQIESSGGLKRMNRNHVHFSTGLPEDNGKEVISGMRSDAEVLVYVDVERSIREGGLKWWMSDNGVVLTEGNEEGMVEKKFFKEVVGRRQNVGVLWKDGEKVADLPEGLVIKQPFGKAGKGAKGSRGGGRGRGR